MSASKDTGTQGARPDARRESSAGAGMPPGHLNGARTDRFTLAAPKSQFRFYV